MTTKEALIVAGNVVLAAVAILLFVEDKMPAEHLALVLGSIGFPSAAALLKMKPDSPAGVMLIAFGAFACAAAAASCGAIERQQLRDGITVVDRSCKLIESISGDGDVKKVCAPVDDVAQLDELLAGGPEAGARDGGH